MSRPRLAIGRKELFLAAAQLPRSITHADLAAVLGCSRRSVRNVLIREGLTLTDLGVFATGSARDGDDPLMSAKVRAEMAAIDWDPPTPSLAVPSVACSVCGAVRPVSAMTALTRGGVTLAHACIAGTGNRCIRFAPGELVDFPSTSRPAAIAA